MKPASAVIDIQQLPNGSKLWVRYRNRHQSWLGVLLGAILRGKKQELNKEVK